ncbi:MAG: hypothetical protein J0M00_21940 [Burkholderiales bacterium]|nr:hypothetical protein [Burkholderiales bacterium]
MIEADDGVLNDDLATVVGCESHKLHAVFNSNWRQGSWLGNFENGVISPLFGGNICFRWV